MNREFTVSVYLLTLLVAAGCAKGRYTEDHHYVGNPERPSATSEPTPADIGTQEPRSTQPR